jgi:hypothetical protein
MECGTQVGVERSAHTSQADATRMHVTRGFYPGKGAFTQGKGRSIILGKDRGVRQKQESSREAQKTLEALLRRGSRGRRDQASLFDILSLNLHMFTFNKTFVPNLSYTH